MLVAACRVEPALRAGGATPPDHSLSGDSHRPRAHARTGLLRSARLHVLAVAGAKANTEVTCETAL